MVQAGVSVQIEWFAQVLLDSGSMFSASFDVIETGC